MIYNITIVLRLPKVKGWGYWTCGQAKLSITSGGPAGLVMIM